MKLLALSLCILLTLASCQEFNEDINIVEEEDVKSDDSGVERLRRVLNTDGSTWEGWLNNIVISASKDPYNFLYWASVQCRLIMILARLSNCRRH